MNMPYRPVFAFLFSLSTGLAVELPYLQITEVVTGLHRPTSLTNAGDGSNRLFITEQTGTIRIVADGKLLDRPFLDIQDEITGLDPLCCDERGLLSMAFPPDFASSGRFYVYYTSDHNEIHISRFHVSADDPNRADPHSEEVLFRIAHEYENHFGGQLAFHPFDHKLYVSLGDGAGGRNPLHTAQDPGSPFGKIWRWDAEGGAGDLELFSLGLRNPWRFSFDSQRGDLYVGDVGEDKWEEVDFQPHGMVGANFGWSILEANQCFDKPECSTKDLIAPAISFDHNTGCSVTGGNVYRGEEFAGLQGVYVYGEFCYGKIWGAVKEADGWTNQLLFEEEGRNWSAFGVDEAGEHYAMDYLPGTIFRIGVAVDHPEPE